MISFDSEICELCGGFGECADGNCDEVIAATTPEKATATEIAYGNLNRMENNNTVQVASGWIHQITSMTTLNHHAFTYNGGDVLHVFLGDTNDANESTYAFLANTTLQLLSDVYQLQEAGHPENFRVPEGWRRMKESSIAISLGKGQDVG